MSEETKSEGETWARLIIGAVLVAVATYAFLTAGFFPTDKPLMPWLVGVGGLIGFGMAVTNAFELYGRRIRKLDGSGAAAFAGDVWGSGIVGIIKWGGILGCLILAYNYLTGPFELLPHGTKLVAILLGVIVIVLFCILVELEKIRKKRP